MTRCHSGCACRTMITWVRFFLRAFFLVLLCSFRCSRLWLFSCHLALACVVVVCRIIVHAHQCTTVSPQVQTHAGEWHARMVPLKLYVLPSVLWTAQCVHAVHESVHVSARWFAVGFLLLAWSVRVCVRCWRTCAALEGRGEPKPPEKRRRHPSAGVARPHSQVLASCDCAAPFHRPSRQACLRQPPCSRADASSPRLAFGVPTS